MVDTVCCYNETDICEKCGNNPVEFIHDGALTDDKFVKLCQECFVKLTGSKNK
jgi:hypothetical protein